VGDIIVLSKRKKSVLSKTDLTGFLKQATMLAKKKPATDVVRRIADKHELKQLLAVKLFEQLKLVGALSSDFFFCSLYVAGVIVENIGGVKIGFWAVDYLLAHEKTRQAEFLKNGGDVCFLICAVFPNWASRRTLSRDYFFQMGGALYLDFYYQTGLEIGFHMSQLFGPMVHIVREALPRL